MTGRRPKRSDGAPWIGVQTNWMAANSMPKVPTHHAACAKSPPVNWRTRPGRTGMITPNDRMSISTVMKMKTRAARQPAGAGLRRSRSGDRRKGAQSCGASDTAHRPGACRSFGRNASAPEPWRKKHRARGRSPQELTEITWLSRCRCPAPVRWRPRRHSRPPGRRSSASLRSSGMSRRSRMRRPRPDSTAPANGCRSPSQPDAPTARWIDQFEPMTGAGVDAVMRPGSRTSCSDQSPDCTCVSPSYLSA